MTIEPIGQGSLALYLDLDELYELCSDEGEIYLDAAQDLIVSAFTECGVKAEGSLELETYYGVSGVLMFARIVEKERQLYFFSDIENVIALSKLLPQPPPRASLTYYNKEYVLMPEAPDNFLYLEFGEKRECKDAYTDLILEHGRHISDDIFSELSRHFFRSQL